MINALHLIWIVPSSVLFGVMVEALLVASK